MKKNYKGKVLSPYQFSGSIHGDYGYEIDGVKSKRSYVSKEGAKKAMYRELDKLEKHLEDTEIEEIDLEIKDIKIKQINL